jgi:phosphatidylinositol alpha 1,6-mannosyltransferase
MSGSADHRLRVAIATESFLPTTNGVTTSVCRVLDHLRDHGHEAIVLAPSAGAPSSYAGFPVFEVPAVPYRGFPVGLPNPQTQRILESFSPDVLHAASPFLFGAAAMTTAGRLGIPSVAIFQTDVAGYARRNGLAAASGIAWRVVRSIHERADLTLVPSSASMDALERAGVRRLARWGRGVDLERYHPRLRATPAVRALRARLAPRGEVVVGYVGRIAPEKQVERLAALRGVRGIRLAIVGDGPSMPAVRRALDGMPVSWLGELGGTALAEAYASLDVFVHTGSEETFGQTLQEAGATGLPVVAPRAGGPIDIVEEGITGFLVPGGANRALRDAVSTLTDDPGLRARMGEAARRRMLGRSWESVGDELVEHYARTVAARSDRVLATQLS